MGAVDLVIQVESPKSVARGLQRIGRAGHELGAVSKGRIFPKFRRRPARVGGRRARDAGGRDRGDRRSRATRSTCSPSRSSRSAADEEIAVDELHELVRGAYPFADLSRVQLENVLDMLAGRYPSDEFAELRPRIVWDRTGGTIRARDGARRLAVTNAGTIPDRGLFGVFLVDGGGRVGELDEEMVYEARAGQTFMLGASTWRIEEITRDRVLVSPAPGAAGRGAVLEGRGGGAAVRARRSRSARPRASSVALGDAAALARLRERVPARRARRPEPARVPARPGRRDRRGALRPHDRGRALPRRDRRLARLHPDAVRRPRARARGRWRSTARLRESLGLDVQSIWSDDGIALHLPDADAPPRCQELLHRPGRGRGARRRGGRRDGALRRSLPRERRAFAADPAPPPRSADAALAAAAEGAVAAPGRAPLRLLPGRARDLPRVPAGRLRPAGAAGAARTACRRGSSTSSRSRPAAPRRYSSSLLFDYIATYMYEDDTPPAERRAQALSLDRDLLRELLGQEELRDLLDADAVAEVERQLRGEPTTPDDAARPASPARRPARR